MPNVLCMSSSETTLDEVVALCALHSENGGDDGYFLTNKRTQAHVLSALIYSQYTPASQNKLRNAHSPCAAEVMPEVSPVPLL